MSIDAEAKKSKFQLRREASYEKLVASAMRAFYERGYAATTVEDIVRDTGHTGGAFYFHFKSKAECFWHVVAYRERLRGNWPAIVDRVSPETTSLRALLNQVFAHFDATLPTVRNWALVTAGFYDAHRDDAETVARLAGLHARWVGEVHRFLDKLVSRSYLEGGEDLERLATEVFAYVEGMMNHANVFSLDLARFNDALIDGLLRLLESPTWTSGLASSQPAEAKPTTFETSTPSPGTDPV